MGEVTFAIEICEELKNVLSGDLAGIPKLLDKGIEALYSIPDYLFYHNLEAMLKGLDSKGTISRKVGEKLASSSYGEEYGYTLLHYLVMYEHVDKGIYMAYLIDSVSHGFITPDEALTYCKLINDISLATLYFLKENVQKQELFKLSVNEQRFCTELENNGLVYKSCNNGIAFEMDAFLLDKFALSYDSDDKYVYDDRNAGIPDLKKFPKKPIHLVLSNGAQYTE